MTTHPERNVETLSQVIERLGDRATELADQAHADAQVDVLALGQRFAGVISTGKCRGYGEHPDCDNPSATIGCLCVRCDVNRMEDNWLLRCRERETPVDPDDICSRCNRIAPCDWCKERYGGGAWR